MAILVTVLDQTITAASSGSPRRSMRCFGRIGQAGTCRHGSIGGIFHLPSLLRAGESLKTLIPAGACPAGIFRATICYFGAVGSLAAKKFSGEFAQSDGVAHAIFSNPNEVAGDDCGDRVRAL